MAISSTTASAVWWSKKHKENVKNVSRLLYLIFFFHTFEKKSMTFEKRISRGLGPADVLNRMGSLQLKSPYFGEPSGISASKRTASYWISPSPPHSSILSSSSEEQKEQKKKKRFSLTFSTIFSFDSSSTSALNGR